MTADGGPRWAEWQARWPNATASRFVEAAGLTWHDVAALLAVLGVRPQLAAGHSAGAAVLVRMALDGALPDARALVGINAAIVPPPELYRFFAGPWLRGLFTGTFASRLAAQCAALTMMTQWELEPLLRRVPTLLLAGAADRWVPPSAARRVAAYVPGADFEVWERQGHLMHEEAGDATAERVLRAGEAHGVCARA